MDRYERGNTKIVIIVSVLCVILIGVLIFTGIQVFNSNNQSISIAARYGLNEDDINEIIRIVELSGLSNQDKNSLKSALFSLKNNTLTEEESKLIRTFLVDGSVLNNTKYKDIMRDIIKQYEVELASNKAIILETIKNEKLATSDTVEKTREEITKIITEYNSTSSENLKTVKEEIINELHNLSDEKGSSIESTRKALEDALKALEQRENTNVSDTKKILQDAIGSLDNKSSQELTYLKEELERVIYDLNNKNSDSLEEAKQILNDLIAQMKAENDVELASTRSALEKALADLESAKSQQIAQARESLKDDINKLDQKNITNLSVTENILKTLIQQNADLDSATKTALENAINMLEINTNNTINNNKTTIESEIRQLDEDSTNRLTQAITNLTTLTANNLTNAVNSLQALIDENAANDASNKAELQQSISDLETATAENLASESERLEQLITANGVADLQTKQVLESAIATLRSDTETNLATARSELEALIGNNTTAINTLNTAFNNYKTTTNNELTRLANLIATNAATEAADKQELLGLIDALKTRMTTAENNITNLKTRMTTAESNITNLQGRTSTAESNITNLQGRMTTAEGDIDDLQSEMTNVKKSVSDGKELVAGTITQEGITTAANATFETIANNISNLVQTRFTNNVLLSKNGRTVTAKLYNKNNTSVIDSKSMSVDYAGTNGSVTVETSGGTGNENFNIADGWTTDITVDRTTTYNAGKTAGAASVTLSRSGRTVYASNNTSLSIPFTGTNGTVYLTTSSGTDAQNAAGEYFNIEDGYATGVYVNRYNTYNSGYNDGYAAGEAAGAGSAELPDIKMTVNGRDVIASIGAKAAQASVNYAGYVGAVTVTPPAGTGSWTEDIVDGWTTSVTVDRTTVYNRAYSDGKTAGYNYAKNHVNTSYEYKPVTITDIAIDDNTYVRQMIYYGIEGVGAESSSDYTRIGIPIIITTSDGRRIRIMGTIEAERTTNVTVSTGTDGFIYNDTVYTYMVKKNSSDNLTNSVGININVYAKPSSSDYYDSNNNHLGTKTYDIQLNPFRIDIQIVVNNSVDSSYNSTFKKNFNLTNYSTNKAKLDKLLKKVIAGENGILTGTYDRTKTGSNAWLDGAEFGSDVNKAIDHYTPFATYEKTYSISSPNW